MKLLYGVDVDHALINVLSLSIGWIGAVEGLARTTTCQHRKTSRIQRLAFDRGVVSGVETKRILGKSRNSHIIIILPLALLDIHVHAQVVFGSSVVKGQVSIWAPLLSPWTLELIIGFKSISLIYHKMQLLLRQVSSVR